MSFKSVLLLVLSLIAGSIAFTGMRTSRMVGSKISMAIPPFNWPGSKMPPSPLETLFGQPIGGGSSSSSSAVKSAPASAKKSAPAAVKSSSKPATKSAAASKAPAKTAAKAAPATKGKTNNFTWGGRPDPTPEAYVEESADFWSFAKGLGKKK